MCFAETSVVPTTRTRSVHEARGKSRLERALARDQAAVRALIADWAPLVQARITRVLVRRGGLARRGAAVVREDVRDLTQDVLATLFADDGRVLRGWAPERGLSLVGYVALVAERHAVSIVRTRRRSPLTEQPTAAEEPAMQGADGALAARLEHRDLARVIAERLERELTPAGHAMFVALFVEERSVEDVCSALETTPDAVYAWRTRIRRAAQRIAAELDH